MTIEAIQAYIAEDAQQRARKLRLYKYYRGEHDILRRQQEDASKPNNRLCHGYPQMIANAYTGYLFADPVTYTATNDDALMDAVNACYKYNDEQSENARIGLDLSICGMAVELMYVDEQGFERFVRVDPCGCIAVTDHTIEDNLTELIRYYDTYDVVTRTNVGTVEVYDAEMVSVYTVTGGIEAGIGTLELVEERPHGFRDVPAVVYKNNPEGMGDFETVLTLIDAYDLMQSEALNDQEYFTDAYLVLYGIGEMTTEDVNDMKQRRVLLMPDDGKASWLIKSQPDALPENIKNRLNKDIQRFSGCPDMSDENFAANASGVAIRYKLLQFENNAGIKERELKRGLQRRLELLCNLWQTLGRGAHDWRSVQISCKRSLPQNLLELSQTLGNLSDIISDETKRSLLPLDIDEDTERARLQEQNGEGLFTPKERKSGVISPTEREDAVKTEADGDGE